MLPYNVKFYYRNTGMDKKIGKAPRTTISTTVGDRTLILPEQPWEWLIGPVSGAALRQTTKAAFGRAHRSRANLGPVVPMLLEGYFFVVFRNNGAIQKSGDIETELF